MPRPAAFVLTALAAAFVCCGGGSTGGPAPDGTATPAAEARYFPQGAPWYQDVSALRSTRSRARDRLSRAASAGARARCAIDFSIEVLRGDRRRRRCASFTPTRRLLRRRTATASRCRVPAGGALEGETRLPCASDGDCHLIVVDAAQKLYEMWRADIARRRLQRRLPRGVGHDAGLPAERPRRAVHERRRRRLPDRAAALQRRRGGGGRDRPRDPLHPAERPHPRAASTCIRRPTPARRAAPPRRRPTAPACGCAPTIPVASLPAGAQVVARALQRYGMLLADGGNIALTAQSDRFTTAKWAGLLETRDLAGPATLGLRDGRRAARGSR